MCFSSDPSSASSNTSDFTSLSESTTMPSSRNTLSCRALDVKNDIASSTRDAVCAVNIDDPGLIPYVSRLSSVCSF